MTQHVLVIGATQGTGLLIANKLIARGDTVTVLARSRAKAESAFSGQPVTIVDGDLTQPGSLSGEYAAYDAIILTAGVTQRPASESLIRAVEYDGTVNLLDAAKAGGFQGRFLYMNSIGGVNTNWLSGLLNLMKGNTLLWRNKVEQAIRDSGFAYTIIRAGILNDKPAGQHQLRIGTGDWALSLGGQVSREDVADVFVAALRQAETANVAFNVVNGASGARQPLGETLAQVV